MNRCFASNIVAVAMHHATVPGVRGEKVLCVPKFQRSLMVSPYRERYNMQTHTELRNLLSSLVLFFFHSGTIFLRRSEKYFIPLILLRVSRETRRGQDFFFFYILRIVPGISLLAITQCYDSISFQQEIFNSREAFKKIEGEEFARRVCFRER